MQTNPNPTPNPAKGSWVSPLLCGLFFSFTFLVFAPLDLYFSNAGEFWFGPGDLALGIALAFLGVWAALFGLCMLLRGKGRVAACGFLFGLGVMLYLQGNFLNPSYGVLNGESIPWDSFAGYAVWNTALWVLAPLGCAALALWKPKGFEGASRFACLVLTLMQLVTLVAVAAQPMAEKKTGYCFTKKDQFHLSNRENILFVILDTVDTTTLREMMAKDSAFFSPLEGFVMYPNSVGPYPVTKFALPYLLTGMPYLFETSYGPYLADSWKNESFFGALKDRGYSIRLYTESSVALDTMAGTVYNLDEDQSVPTSRAALVGMMYRFAGFRYAPHLLKPSLWFYNDGFSSLRTLKEGSVYVSDDALFLSELRQSGVQCDVQAPVFALYHLEGAHVPITLRGDGTRAPQGQPVSMDEQLRAVFGGVFSMLEQMKAQGVYDQSTIILTSDHGNIVLDRSPMLMIKPPHATGPVQAHAALASQEDLHQTMLSAAGIDVSLPYGEDLLALPQEDTGRETVHYNFRWADGDVFTEYQVALDQTGQALYTRTGLQYKPDGIYELETPELAPGATVSTANLPALAPYTDEICAYFQEEKAGGVQLYGPWQHFQWQLPWDAEYTDLLVRFHLADVANGAQRVQVFSGTDLIDTVGLRAGDGELRFTLPGDFIQDGLVEFTFRFPDAVSPYTLSGGTDTAHYQRPAIRISGFTTQAVD